MEPYMSEVGSVCLFSGEPILKEELEKGAGNFHWFYQTIVVKFGETQLKKYRRAYCVRSSELNKNPMRLKLLKDLMYIELDFDEIQAKFEHELARKELEQQYKQRMETELNTILKAGSDNGNQTPGEAEKDG